jgi:hypothetical protein
MFKIKVTSKEKHFNSNEAAKLPAGTIIKVIGVNENQSNYLGDIVKICDEDSARPFQIVESSRVPHSEGETFSLPHSQGMVFKLV